MLESRKVWGCSPVGVGCAMRVVSLQVRGYAPDNEPLVPSSALLSSASSTHPKPKTRFRSVFGCLGNTRGGVCERERRRGQTFILSLQKEHALVFRNLVCGDVRLLEHEQRERLMQMMCFLRQDQTNNTTTIGWNQWQSNHTHTSPTGLKRASLPSPGARRLATRTSCHLSCLQNLLRPM